MEKLGFTREDLAVFGIDSIEKREAVVREHLRPRLEAIAYRFAPALSRLAGVELSAVIQVEHEAGPRARAIASFIRTGGDRISEPYFSFVVTRGGVHARLVVERQFVNRAAIAARLSRAATAIAKEFRDVDLRCYDDWDGYGIPALTSASKAPFWKEVAERLGKASGSLDIGAGWPEARAVLLSHEDLLPTYRTLLPLYRRIHEGLVVGAAPDDRRRITDAGRVG
jgi:uncharacterized protein YktB (UPF0637 family)